MILDMLVFCSRFILSFIVYSFSLPDFPRFSWRLTLPFFIALLPSLFVHFKAKMELLLADCVCVCVSCGWPKKNFASVGFA